MANPKNPGYLLALHPTADPDVVHVVESDDVEGRAPVRAVSAVEAGRLAAAKVVPSNKPAGGATTPAKKAPAAKAPAKKAPVKKVGKRG